MPSRKQRRRRQKDRRHEYEYVYLDEEGRELAVEEVEPDVAQQNGAAKKRDSPAGRSRPASKARAPQQRGKAGGREVLPPSWPRVLKRAAVFAPFMFASIYLIDRKLGMPGTLLVTAQMLVVFIPFSYLMDRTLYRRFLRQSAVAGPAKGARRRG